MVKSVKTPLKKILGNALLSTKELYTILTDIEAMINSRSLKANYSCSPISGKIVTKYTEWFHNGRK